MSKKLLIAAAMLMWGSLTALPALADEANVFGALDTVAASDLDSARGMHTPEIEDLEGALQAVLDGNTSVDNGSLRTNTIDASFVGATGIATVIQNAGNNVIIQTATMVTVNYN
jgi:hypothetical protein